MIQAVISISVTSENRSPILRSMRSMVGPTRAQQGCLDCRVLIDAADPQVLTLIQTWQSRTDLERHVRSRLFRTVLAVMESSVDRPAVAFHTISKTEGLEAVQDVRTTPT